SPYTERGESNRLFSTPLPACVRRTSFARRGWGWRINNMAERMRITIAGAVQGVGFRPFVYRLASDLGIAGWVNNSPQGVMIEAEASPESLQAFLARLQSDKPAHALIQCLSAMRLTPVGYTQFEIRQSENSGGKTALILPDLAICAECLREIL